MSAIETLKPEIEDFITKPSPLWETELTHKLVEAKYEVLKREHKFNRASYSTASVLKLSDSLNCKQFLTAYSNNAVYLEKSDAVLSDFYGEHGLEPLTDDALTANKAVTQLRGALNLLNLVPECAACVAELINCIQVIASEGPDYDTSYSHPDLPFTIFVSVCEEDSLNARLRIAEGVLHEAMHLKLTLIQNHIELVKSNSTGTFYSPWRDAERPLTGVLHGIFVFRAIRDFFRLLQEQKVLDDREYNFAGHRIDDIETDFRSLRHFPVQPDLTKDGASLSANLLPLN